MLENRSVLYDRLKVISQSLSPNELSIDDLLSDETLAMEFSNDVYKLFKRAELIEGEDEDEPSNEGKEIEYFNRDILISLTDHFRGKEVPNLCNSYSADKCVGDYYNSYFNEFNSRVLDMTSYLLSIVLKKTQDPANKEQIVTKMEELKKSLFSNESLQRNFFALFTNMKTLVKLITLEKQYDELVSSLPNYLTFFKKFCRDCPTLILLIYDQIIELSNAISNCIIKNQQLGEDLRKKGMICLFSVASCFQLGEIFLDFVTLQEKYKFCLSIETELKEFFNESQEICSSFFLNAYGNLNYSKELLSSDYTSFCCDESYLYYYGPMKGLLKIGAMKSKAIFGKVYLENSEVKKGHADLVYTCGKIFLRTANVEGENEMGEICPETLQYHQLKETLSEETYDKLYLQLYGNKETKISFEVKAHTIQNYTIEKKDTIMFADQRFLYILAEFSPVVNIEKEYQYLLWSENLPFISVFDPLDNLKFVGDFPLLDSLRRKDPPPEINRDKLKVCSNGVSIFFQDGTVIWSYNIVTGGSSTTIQEVACKAITYSFSDSSILLMNFQSVLELNSLTCTESFSFSKNLSGEYSLPYSVNWSLCKLASSEKKEEECEKKVFTFFLKRKQMTTTEPYVTTEQLSYKEINSFVLQCLAKKADISLNRRFNENFISLILQEYSLNLNDQSNNQLFSMVNYYYETLSRSDNESTFFMLSSLLVILKGRLNSIVELNIDQFGNFSGEIVKVKEIINICIQIILSYMNKDDDIGAYSLNLLSESIQIVELYSERFGVDFPSTSLFLDILFRNEPRNRDIRDLIINLVVKRKNSILNRESLSEFTPVISQLINKSITKLNQDIFPAIVKDSKFEITCEIDNTQKVIEIFFCKFINNLLNSFNNLMETKKMSCSEEEKESEQIKAEKVKASNNFIEKQHTFNQLYSIAYKGIKSLIDAFASFASVNLSIENEEEKIVKLEKIYQYMSTNTFIYRSFLLLHKSVEVMTEHSDIVFQMLPKVLDMMKILDSTLKVLFDSSISLNQGSKVETPYFVQINTSHPLMSEYSVTKSIHFDEDTDLHFTFLGLRVLTVNSYIEIKSKDKKIRFDKSHPLRDITLYKCQECEYSINLEANSYGLKMLIHNKNDYSRRFPFSGIQDININFINKSIEKLFFYRSEKKSKINNEIEDVLESKLFSGGIEEFFDFEASSIDFKSLIEYMRNDVSTEPYLLKKILCTKEDKQTDETEDTNLFFLEEILNKHDNEGLTILIDYFQKSLVKRFPWINAGGEKVEYLIRGMFAIAIKQEKTYPIFIKMIDELKSLHDDKGELEFNDLSAITGFDYYLIIWSELSRIRQWYSEQIKDLAELSAESFEKQNNEFIEKLVKKINFIFSINPPKEGQKPTQKQIEKVKFLEAYALTDKISKNTILKDDSFKANLINYRKNIMQSKIDEQYSIVKVSKDLANSILGCVKMTKVSIEDLNMIMKETNTRAKFREVAMTLIVYVLSEVNSNNIKLIIALNLIRKIRNVYGKKLISVDENIKSASSRILMMLQNRFHEYIKLIAVNILSSNSEYYVTSFMDCLTWSFRARDHQLLNQVSLFNIMFINSRNQFLASAWKDILKANTLSSQKNNIVSYNHELLQIHIRDFFSVVSTMIVGRIIDETHDQTEEKELTLSKKKSSIMDNNSEVLLVDIIEIINQQLTIYLNSYFELWKTQEAYKNLKSDINQFTKTYFNEHNLHFFLVHIYKFYLNPSDFVIKQMKNPNLTVNLLLLLSSTSSINIYLIVNILKLHFTHSNEEDEFNIIHFLIKHEMFTIQEFDNLVSEESSAKTIIVYFLLSIAFRMQSYLNNEISETSDEYFQSYHIIELIRYLHSLGEDWQDTIETALVIMLSKNESNNDAIKHLISYAILNAECPYYYYGSKVLLRNITNKTVVKKIDDKDNERSSLRTGFCIGFSNHELKLEMRQEIEEFESFFYSNNISHTFSNERYAVVTMISDETYNKEKLKNNDIEIITIEVEKLISETGTSTSLKSNALKSQVISNYLEQQNKENKGGLVMLVKTRCSSCLYKNFTQGTISNEEMVEVVCKIGGFQKTLEHVIKTEENMYKSLVEREIHLNKMIQQYLECDVNKAGSFASTNICTPTKALTAENKVVFKLVTGGRVGLKIFNARCNLCFSLVCIQYSNIQLSGANSDVINFLPIVIAPFDAYPDIIKHIVVVDLQICPEDDLIISHLNNRSNVLLLGSESLDFAKRRITSPFIVLEQSYFELCSIIEAKKLVEYYEPKQLSSLSIEDQEFRKSVLDSISPQKVEGSTIKYTANIEVNIMSSIYTHLKVINMKVAQFDPAAVESHCINISKVYLRKILVKLVAQNFDFVSEDNYVQICGLFKLTFLDQCKSTFFQYFDYQNFATFFEFLNKSLEFEEHLSDYRKKFINPSAECQLIDSFSNCQENNIPKNIQSEMINCIMARETECVLSAESISKFEDSVFMILTFTKLSLSQSTKMFIDYSDKFIELLKKYTAFVSSDIDKFANQIEERGLSYIIAFLNVSIEKEKTLTSRTKMIMNFIYLVMSIINNCFINRKIERRFSIKNSVAIMEILNSISLLENKLEDVHVKRNYIFANEVVYQALKSEYSVPMLPKHTYEIKLNFTDCSEIEVIPDNDDGKNKCLMSISKGMDGSFNLKDIVNLNDRQLSIRTQPDDILIIADKSNVTDEIWSCGYNERYKLGHLDSAEYSYVYEPKKVCFDKPATFRVTKIISGAYCTHIASADNKIYSVGESYNSGLESKKQVFTSDNQWNAILAKGERFVDFEHNTNTAMVMITNKNFYVSGYNYCNMFGDVCGSGSYTSGIMPLTNIPFKAQKVRTVALGYSHMLVQLDDGVLYGSGSNGYQELLSNSVGSTVTTLTKIPLPSGLKCIGVTCGYYSSIVNLESGNGKKTLYSGGENGYGLQGRGSGCSNAMDKIGSISAIDFRFVKIGYLTACAISTKGELYTWGYNSYYQCGTRDQSYVYEPRKIDFYDKMTVLSADVNERTLTVRVITENKKIKLYVTGYNGYACLGIGSQTDTYFNTPQEIKDTTENTYYSYIMTGISPYVTFFCKSKFDKLKKPFATTCFNTKKEVVNNAIFKIEGENVKKFISEEALSEYSDSVFFGIRGLEVKDDFKDISLPSLENVTNVVTECVPYNCSGCHSLCDETYNFVYKLNSKISVFCRQCYGNDPVVFKYPKFVYIARKNVDLETLPDIDTDAILYVQASDELKFILNPRLTTKGLNNFKETHTEIFSKVEKEYDDLSNEQLLEYINFTDEDDEVKFQALLKENNNLCKLTDNQIDILKTVAASLSSAVSSIRTFVDAQSANELKRIFISNLSCLQKSSRNALFEKLLYENASNVDPNSYYVQISRGKSIKFKSKKSKDFNCEFTVFGQVYHELISKVPVTQYRGNKSQRLFRVELRGEGATDAGGPFRDIMDMAFTELQSPLLELLIPTPNNKTSSGTDREKFTINPDAHSTVYLDVFKIIGRIFGWAIRSTNFLNLNLPSFIWKKISNSPLDIKDLEKIDVHAANYLNDLLILEEKGVTPEIFEECYDQNFTTMLSNGQEVEVIANGKNIKLTYENREMYVKAALNTRFSECDIQIEKIKEGLL